MADPNERSERRAPSPAPTILRIYIEKQDSKGAPLDATKRELSLKNLLYKIVFSD